MQTRTAVLIAAVSCVAPIACGTGQAVDETRGTATMTAALGGDFTGNYAKISGRRAVPADSKYPCLNEFNVCVPLSATGAAAAITDLCPTIDTPAANWSFSYTLYNDPACTSQLANMACVPHPDESLAVGHNVNPVECWSRNGDKAFDLCVVDPITGAGRENCPPELRDVLVLQPTIASKPGGVPVIATEKAIRDLGFNPVVKSAAEWATMKTADFSYYRAIVLGDPLNPTATNCAIDPSAFAAAEANTNVWGPAVTGNVMVIGSDPTFHVDIDSHAGAYKLIKDGLNFAAWKPYQTGLYVSLACAYSGSTAQPIKTLGYFGDFRATGAGSEKAHIVGTAEPLADLTDADLSSWGTSVHQSIATLNFTGPDFKPFAVIQPSATPLPYIVARGLE